MKRFILQQLFIRYMSHKMIATNTNLFLHEKNAEKKLKKNINQIISNFRFLNRFDSLKWSKTKLFQVLFSLQLNAFTKPEMRLIYS